MNKKVILVAEGIQVTASNESDASRYLREDACDFSSDWNYDETVEATTQELTEDSSDVHLEVEVDIPRGRGERLWTGRAIFEVIVKDQDDDVAIAEAKILLAA